MAKAAIARAEELEKQMRANLIMGDGNVSTPKASGLEVIAQRFNQLTEQLYAELDDLTKALDPVLKQNQPQVAGSIAPTQAGESPVFSYLQEKLDTVESAIMRVRALRLLLDL